MTNEEFRIVLKIAALVSEVRTSLDDDFIAAINAILDVRKTTVQSHSRQYPPPRVTTQRGFRKIRGPNSSSSASASSSSSTRHRPEHSLSHAPDSRNAPLASSWQFPISTSQHASIPTSQQQQHSLMPTKREEREIDLKPLMLVPKRSLSPLNAELASLKITDDRARDMFLQRNQPSSADR